MHNMKYVVFDGRRGEHIIIFPDIIQHSVMAANVTKSSFDTLHPISGGFIVDGECTGESESLRMVSRGADDTALIPRMLDLDLSEASWDGEDTAPVVKSILVNRNRAKRLRKKRNK